MPDRVLVVEDDESLRQVAEYHLAEEGYDVLVARDAESALETFREKEPDVVVSDIRLPGMSGLDLLRRVKDLRPETEVILMTAYGTVEQAVEAMKEGAFDYVTKPVRWEEMRLVVARALERRRLLEENVRMRAELAARFRPENLVTRSPAMQQVLELLGRVVSSDAPVLILGESGTGKELVARALHYQGPRREGPFVPVNCAAIPKDLLESELFGVRKGAFTGADRDRQGRFLQAHRGTLFLDEIAELPPELQVKLLRALQEKEVVPLGGDQPVKVDVRIVSATNQPVDRLLQEGKLRKDLYYRINVVSVVLPPLRERPEDIPLLVEHFLRQQGAADVRVTPEAMRLLEAYSWPGNVRELENVVERALLLRRSPAEITPDDLPQWVRDNSPGDTAESTFPDLPPGGWNIYELEKHLIRKALERTGGNQTRAAQLLGMTRQTLIYRMQKYGLQPPAGENDA
jgi:two-component system NtrC family response regulator